MKNFTMDKRFVIKKSEITEAELDDISQIHYDNISGNLTKLGKSFIKKIYLDLLSSNKNFVTILKNKTEIIGFVIFSLDTKKSKYLFIKKIFFFLIWFSLLSIFSLKIINLIRLIFEARTVETSEAEVELYTITVKEKYSNQGFGKELILESEKYLKSLNILSYIVRTDHKNILTNKFYKKAGFEFFMKRNNSNFYKKKYNK